MKRIIITHNDLDGCIPILLLEYFKINYNDLLITDYEIFNDNSRLEYILEFDEIFFIDFCPDEFFTERLISSNKKWKVFDHHEARKFISELPSSNNYEIFFDMKECGTSLFFKNFIMKNIKRVKPIIKRIVQLTLTYDTWQKDSDDWEEALSLNRIFYKQKEYNSINEFENIQPFLEKQIRKIENWNFWGWTDIEKTLIKEVKQKEQDLLLEAKNNLHFRKDHFNKKFGVFCVPAKISIVCSNLLNEFSNLDYIIAINTYGGLNGKLSARSVGDFNCNDLFIFNGHNAAAGAIIDVDILIEFLNNKNWVFAYNSDIENPDNLSDRYDIFKVGESLNNV